MFKKYIGVKEVKAKPMTRGEYNNYRGWDLPKNENGDDLGFLKDDGNGHEQWDPIETFERDFRELKELTFGLAIEALRMGKCVARNGWNGKNMFICKQVPSIIGSEIIPNMQSLPRAAKDLLSRTSLEPIRYSNQMIIVKNNHTGDRIIDSWVASSSDTFAEDWYIID